MENVQNSKTKEVWRPDGYRESLTFGQYKAYLIEAANKLEPDFKLDAHFKELITALSLYFWDDPEFEKKGYGSLKKGIFLTGNVGVGKTLLMKLFRVNTKRVLKIESTNTVADGYQTNGIEYMLATYCSSRYVSHFCFDDIGAETIGIKHMGNEMNVMARLILERYEMKQHYFTHFTSNLDANGVEELYGTRVRSRLREMVNFFELGGTDRRK